MPVNLTRVRNNILDEASQDWIAFHEIVADCHEPGQEIPENERVAAAKNLVHEILATHDGRISRTLEWPPEKWHEVPRDCWEAVIASDSSWRIESNREPVTLYWLILGSSLRLAGR